MSLETNKDPGEPGFRMGCVTGISWDRKPFELDTPDGRVRVVWRWFPGKNAPTSFHFGCLTGAAMRAVLPERVLLWILRRLG